MNLINLLNYFCISDSFHSKALWNFKRNAKQSIHLKISTFSQRKWKFRKLVLQLCTTYQGNYALALNIDSTWDVELIFTGSEKHSLTENKGHHHYLSRRKIIFPHHLTKSYLAWDLLSATREWKEAEKINLEVFDNSFLTAETKWEPKGYIWGFFVAYNFVN